MAILNLAHACVTEGVNGPGRRFTVWVQGCPHACPGCFNPGLRSEQVKRLVDPAVLAEELVAAGPVEGVTLSGGEPFAQATALSEFLEAVAGAGLPPLPVIAFSGYTVDQLRAGPSEWTHLLGRVDLLVDGPYRQELAELPGLLAGSANQRRIALTAAGARLLAQVEAGIGGEVQVLITADGELVVSGFPPAELLLRLRSSLVED